MTRMIRARIGCEFELNAPKPAHTVVQVEPIRTGHISLLREEWIVAPDVVGSAYRDAYGNRCRRVDLPAGAASIRYDALVEVPAALDDFEPAAGETPPEALPADVLVYTLPSRYCLSDVLLDEAERLFGATPPGWGRVQAVCDFVHDSITFQYGATSPLTTAVDVYQQRRGVCRDFTQLAITFCRALQIPARYAFGYMPDIGVEPDGSQMDFCAWMEVWLGGRWYTFDPRNNVRRAGRILIGRGRDAVDCAMLTSYGTVGLELMTVWADEVPAPAGMIMVA